MIAAEEAEAAERAFLLGLSRNPLPAPAAGVVRDLERLLGSQPENLDFSKPA